MAKAKNGNGKGKEPPPPATPVDPADVPLSHDEQLFVEEYLLDRNWANAYRRLHPDANHSNARRLGWAIGHRPNVRREIRNAIHAMRLRKRATADAVIDELAMVALSDVLDLYDPQTHQLRHPRHIPYETRKTIASIRVSRERTTTRTTGRTRTRVVDSTVEYRLWNKIEALGKLARHLGLDTEITPLESLLRALPRELATAVRNALTQAPRTTAHTNGAMPNGKH